MSRHIKSRSSMALKHSDPAKEGEEASKMTLGRGWEDKEDIIKGIQLAEDDSEVWADFKDEGAASEGGMRAEHLQESEACELDNWVYAVPMWAPERLYIGNLGASEGTTRQRLRWGSEVPARPLSFWEQVLEVAIRVTHVTLRKRVDQSWVWTKDLPYPGGCSNHWAIQS